jgi:4-amino-4-deoxy-L-arabinose transferase-like glycosyltransferase
VSIDDAGARRRIAAAAAVALLLRLLFALTYWVDRPLTHDEHEYLSLARGLASGAGFVYDDAVDTGTAQRFGRAPGYPVFLAGLDAGRPVPSSTPARVKVAQSLVGAATVWLLGLIALGAAGPRPGVVAAALAAIYPPLITIPAYAFSETVYSFVAFATIFVLQRAVERTSPDAARRTGPVLLALASGLLGGVAALVRPAMLLFLPLAFAWLLYRRRLVLALALTIGATLVVAPWTVRNVRVYDRLVLIASEGGVTFWTGNNPLAGGEGDLAANPAIKEAELALRQRHAGLSPEQMEPIYYREALTWITEEPGRWLLLELRKAFYTIVPIGPSYAVHSARYRFASIVPYLMVLPFALPGAIRLWRSARRPTPLFLLAGSAVLMCLVFFPQERFRLPVLDPALLIAAAALTGRART